jgi:DNA repair protein RadA/Sms
VLDKRAGMSFAQLDVFVNVVGGLRVMEPSADLALAAALSSSVYDRALPGDSMYMGELGLGGEIRPVSQIERRLSEGGNLGLRRAFVSERGLPRRAPAGVEVVPVRTVGELLQRAFT